MIARVLLGAVGVAGILWGGWQLIEATPADVWPNVLGWLAGGVLLHDAVLAPIVLALAWCATRTLPQWARPSVAAGFLVLGTVTILAIPVLGPWQRPANPGIINRDYLTGWLIVAGSTVVVVAVSCLLARWRGLPRAERRTSEGRRS